MDVRKWSVRKVRRRPRSCDTSRKNRNKGRLKSNASNDDLRKAVKEENESTTSEESKEAEPKDRVLLFGSDLDKQPMVGAIEFSSDQESTGGEDDDQPLGKFD